VTSPQPVLGGRYRLTSPIAAGGMGEVWQATDELLGRDVAVKLLGRNIAADPSFRDRFRSEARITAALTDPGIAQVFDYGESDGLAYLVMELVTGEPLSAILARNGMLGPDVTLDLVHQTAKGLYAAHRAAVIHRDIKPGNLLVNVSGQIKITDFGIARALEAAPLTRTGIVLGTAQYVSPEQASGSTLTPATDIYSLGVVAYECLAGRLPFVADNQVALALRHLNDTPPPLPETVPAPVRALVFDMLAKDPAARPATGRELVDRVAALRGALTTPGTAALITLTDPEGFARTRANASSSGPVPGTHVPGTQVPRTTGGTTQAGWSDDAAAPTTGHAIGRPPAAQRRGGPAPGPFAEPSVPARGGHRRAAAVIFVAVGCAAAVSIGVLAFNTTKATPTSTDTTQATTQTPSTTPSLSPFTPRPSSRPTHKVLRPETPVPSTAPPVLPSATVSTSAPPTRQPTPEPSPTRSPTPTSTPTPTSASPPAPSETSTPTDAPTDTSPPNEGT
jgi:serine/threonine-protein kinase